jgi:hypothetical protein
MIQVRYPIGQDLQQIYKRENAITATCIVGVGGGWYPTSSITTGKPWSVTETLSGREHVRVASDVHIRYFWNWELVTEELE